MGNLANIPAWLRLSALACGLLLTPGAAQAQFFGGLWGSRFSFAAPPQEDYWQDERAHAPRMMPPRAVFRLLAQDGYRVISPIIPRGRVYLADVADAETGQNERLVIDAFSGDIVEAYPLGQRFAPPARVERGHVPQAGLYAAPVAPQRQARLAPHAARGPEAGDPLVIPGLGAAPRPRPLPRAHLPRKPKAVAARHAPVDPGKPGILPKPLPVEAQPLAPAPNAAAPPNATAPIAVTPASPPVPSAPPLETATPVIAPPPVAAAAPAVVNDIPPAPLDDATPVGKVHSPVNDVPVAPLE